MAELFSLVSAAAGLLDVTLRLVNYARELKRGAATIQKELDSLIEEACALEQVCNAVNYTYNRNVLNTQEKEPHQSSHDQSNNGTRVIWEGLNGMMSHCRVIVETLYEILREICQPSQQSLSRHTAVLKTVRKKQSKEEQLRECRRQLFIYHSSMQILLTIINGEEARGSCISMAKSLEDIKAQLRGLESYISSNPNSTDEHEKEVLLALRQRTTSATNTIELGAPHTVNKYFKTPQSVSSIFTGREFRLQELRDCFIQPPGPLYNQVQRRFVVHGLGGSGKTQFCCKFAEDNREKFWGVFSIDGSSVESIKKSLGDIAKLAGREPNVNAALDWLSTIEQQWLLLIDNADDADVQLEDYFPKGVGGHILITTRNSAFRVLGNVEPGYYDFSGLDFDEASKLLLKASSLPRPWESSWESLASNITKTLGYLALAIVQAGAAIRERLCNLQGFLGWYERSWQKLRDDDKVRPASRHEQVVWTTFEICYQRLEQKQGRTEAADAMELLHVFAFLYRDNLSPVMLTKALKNAQLEAEHDNIAPAEESNSFRRQSSLGEKLQRRLASFLMFMIRPATPTPLPSALHDGRQAHTIEAAEDRIRSALSELEKVALIYYNERNQTYSMHPVVHDWARKRMKLRHQALWADIAGHVLSASILLPPLGKETEDEVYHGTLLPHIEHIQRCRADVGAQLKLKSRQSWISRLVQGSPVNADRIRMYAKFSLVYAQCGDFLKAELLLAEVTASLALSEIELCWIVHCNLWKKLFQRARREWEAERLILDILPIARRNLGAHHIGVLFGRQILATMLIQQERYTEAERILVEVIEHQKLMSSRSQSHEFHPDRIVSMIELARCYERQGQLKNSIDTCDKTIQGLEKVVRNGHPFIPILKEARGQMEGLLSKVQDGELEPEAMLDVRFPEYLFKIYDK
ncbi:tetratricopeptide repeat domain-containing protein [Xylaria acuta]|nr:tetratricopeptide repeat domain-containing protein [Xylaria acuta]